MPVERPEPGYQWLRVPVKGEVVVTVIGECWCWWCHWTGGKSRRLNRAVRCLRSDGAECAWCQAGYTRNCRYVLPVLDGDRRLLVEFSKVVYPVLSMLEDAGGLPGRRIRLVRAQECKNGRIDIEPVGKGHYSPEQAWDIQAIVRELGRSELAVSGPPRPFERSVELPADRERSHGNRVVNPEEQLSFQDELARRVIG